MFNIVSLLGAAWTSPFLKELQGVLVVIFIVVGSMASAYCVYLGFMLAKADNESKRKQAKDRMIKTLASVFIIVVLFGILLSIDFFEDTVDRPMTTFGAVQYEVTGTLWDPSSPSKIGSITHYNPDGPLSSQQPVLIVYEITGRQLVNPGDSSIAAANTFMNNIGIRTINYVNFEILNATNSNYPVRLDITAIIYTPERSLSSAQLAQLRANPATFPITSDTQMFITQKRFSVFVADSTKLNSGSYLDLPDDNDPQVNPALPVEPGGGSGGSGGSGGGSHSDKTSPDVTGGVFSYWPVPGKPSNNSLRGGGFGGTHRGQDTGWTSPSKGTCGVASNVPVFAVHDGTVSGISRTTPTCTTKPKGQGCYNGITISHTGPFTIRDSAGVAKTRQVLYSQYFHTTAWTVGQGDRVKAGQHIGWVSQSACHAGHVHFEVYSGTWASRTSQSGWTSGTPLSTIADSNNWFVPLMMYPNHGISWQHRLGGSYAALLDPS